VCHNRLLAAVAALALGLLAILLEL